MNKNAINAGVLMLRADADACVLPDDRTRQRHLNEAARILSAAPDLIAALRDLTNYMESWAAISEGTERKLAAARAAIAKATREHK